MAAENPHDALEVTATDCLAGDTRGEGFGVADPGAAAALGSDDIARPLSAPPPRRSYIWLAALVAAFVAGALAHAVAGLLQVVDVAPAAAAALSEELEHRRVHYLRDLLDAERAQLVDPVGAAQVQPAGAAALAVASGAVAADLLLPPSAPARAGRPGSKPSRAVEARTSSQRVGTDALAAGAHPDYERLYGSAARYAAAAHAPLQAGGGGGPPRGRTVGRGVVLQARVVNELASSPVNATAIATLTAPSKFAATLLPVGTQLHGSVRGSGNSGTRLFVDFQFARLASGETFALQATASDRQGREGIPGRKDLSKAAAGSVGLSAAARAGEAAGRSLAGSLGTILGAGVEGAASSSGSKVGRLDRDDEVVLVARGTPIRVYVQSFELEGD